MKLDLTAEEATLLRQVLEAYLSDLRMEIVDTEAEDLRESLKTDEATIKRLISRLVQPADAAA